MSRAESDASDAIRQARLSELKECLECFVSARGEEIKWEQLAFRYDLLRLGLRDAVHLARGGDYDPRPTLTNCSELLALENTPGEPSALRQLKIHFNNARVDCARLYRNACALVATAQAAVAALRVPIDGDAAWADLLAAWKRAVLCFLEPGEPDAPNLDVVKTPTLLHLDPSSVIEYAAGEIAKQGGNGISDALVVWTRYWTDERISANSEASIRVPVLATTPNGGCVAFLELTELAPVGKPSLIQHPDSALLPLDDTLPRTILTEWNRRAHRTKRSICWRLYNLQPGLRCIQGDSLGGGAAAAFDLLIGHRPYDIGCVILAKVNDAGRLERVGSEFQKLQVARESKKLHTAVVAPDTDLTAFQFADFECQGLNVERKSTIQEAVEWASGLATGLREYFRMLTAWPDREAMRPAYLGDRTPTELFVWPDVLEREKSKPDALRSRLQGGRQADERRGRDPGGRASLPPEALEIGEDALYGQRDEETDRRVAWKDAVRDLKGDRPRVIAVLGPPGAGKSELIRMEVRDLATQALGDVEKQAAGLDRLPLPIILSFTDLIQADVEHKMTLRECLHAALREKFGAAWRPMDIDQKVKEQVITYIVDHVRDRRTWLLLDGLDELQDQDTQQIARHFETLRSWQCRVLISSRPFQFERWRNHLPPNLVEYRIAPLSDDQSIELVEKWYGEGQPGHLIDQLLQRSPSLRQIAQNPFLLTLLCWVAMSHLLPDVPTRAEIYDYAVRDLLGLKTDGSGEIDGRRADELLRMMTEVSLRLFGGAAPASVIKCSSLLNAIAEIEDPPSALEITQNGTCTRIPIVTLASLKVDGQAGRAWASYLVEELSHPRKRLLSPVSRDRVWYAFPHRSIVEYLVACGLERGLADAKRAEDTWNFIDKKAWDPQWEQVIVFLAGRLSDSPEHLHRLLAILNSEQTDDILRHRLGLAALCVPEIAKSQRSSLLGDIDAIAEAVFSRWLEAAADWNLAGCKNIDVAISALAEAGGRIDGRPLATQLLELLRSEHATIRNRAMWRLCDLGRATATLDVLGPIVEMLHDRDEDVQSNACTVLEHVFPPEQEHLSLILELLRDQDVAVRAAGVGIVKNLGRVASVPEVRERLVDMLHDQDWWVQWIAATALREMGNATAEPEFTVQLLEWLDDDDTAVQRELLEAFKENGSFFTLEPKISARLAYLLHSGSPENRTFAAKMAGYVGSYAATPEMVGGVFEMLRDQDRELRMAAVDALRKIELRGGVLEATPEILRGLLDMFHGQDAEVRTAAADALMVIEMWPDVPAVPEIQRELIDMLHNQRAAVRIAAAKALGWIHYSAASPETLGGLLDMLHDREVEVRVAAAQALRGVAVRAHWDRLLDMLHHQQVAVRIAARRELRASTGRRDYPPAGAVGWVPPREILVGLIEMLGHEDQGELQSAGWALMDMGGAVATPEVIKRLLEIPLLRDVAAHLVERVGTLPATPEILAWLLEMLRGQSWQMTRSAAKALSRMGSAAATPEILESLSEMLRDQDPRGLELAARAPNLMGSATATPEIVEALVKMFHHEAVSVRREASWVLRRFADEGLRIFQHPPSTLSARHVSHLSRVEEISRKTS